MTKQCIKCKLYLNKSLYFKKAASPDGLQYTCKGCSLKQQRQWRLDNPDKYKEDGKTIKSCFTFSKTNTIKATTKNFNKRFNLLVEKIKYYIDNEPEKEITVEKLFFDS